MLFNGAAFEEVVKRAIAERAEVKEVRSMVAI